MRRRQFLAVSCLTWYSAATGSRLLAQTPTQATAARTIEVPQAGRRGRSVVSAVAVNTAGTEVAAAGDDHMVRTWKINEATGLRTLQRHTDWVRCVAYSPDDKVLASGGDDRLVVIWNAESGQVLRTMQLPARAVYALAFSPESEQLAIGGFDSKLHIRSVTTGEEIRTLDCTCRDIRSVAWARNGAALAAAGQDGKLLLWQAADGKLLHTLNAGRRRIRGLSFSPDSTQIASASEGRHIRLFDVANGAELAHFDVSGGKLMSIVHCGQDVLATGGSDNLIRLWSLTDKQEIKQLTGHKGSIDTLAYNAATDTLISGSFDTTVKFWPMGETSRTTLNTFPQIR